MSKNIHKRERVESIKGILTLREREVFELLIKNYSTKEIAEELKKQEDMANKRKVKAVIMSDYYVYHEKEQDVNEIESMEELDTKRHLILDLKKGPLVIATYDYVKGILSIRDCGINYIFPGEYDPIRMFLKESCQEIEKNMRVAREVVKKKHSQQKIKHL